MLVSLYPKAGVRLSWLLTLPLFLTSCGRTPDARLEQLFNTNRSDFEHLATVVSRNQQWVNVAPDVIFTGTSRIDLRQHPKAFQSLMPEAQWKATIRLMQELGIRNIKKSKKGDVYFTINDVSVFNGDAEKGIECTTDIPTTILQSLDAYRPTVINGKRQYRVYKKISDCWYLYLFIMS